MLQNDYWLDKWGENGPHLMGALRLCNTIYPCLVLSSSSWGKCKCLFWVCNATSKIPIHACVLDRCSEECKEKLQQEMSVLICWDVKDVSHACVGCFKPAHVQSALTLPSQCGTPVCQAFPVLTDIVVSTLKGDSLTAVNWLHAKKLLPGDRSTTVLTQIKADTVALPWDRRHRRAARIEIKWMSPKTGWHVDLDALTLWTCAALKHIPMPHSALTHQFTNTDTSWSNTLTLLTA